MKQYLYRVAYAAGLLCVGCFPSAAPCAAQAPAAGTPAAGEAPEKIDDPVVQAVLDTHPQTPFDQIEVMLLVLDRGYPQVVRPMLVKLLATAVDEAQLADLGRRLGRARLARVAAVPLWQPEAKQLVERIDAARDKQDRDPARIAALIGRLQDASFDVRAAAVQGLQSGRETAAEALIGALVDPARQAEQRGVRTALAALGSDAIGPLTAVASAPDEALRIAAVDTLALIPDPRAAAPVYMAAFAPTAPPAVRQAAAAALTRRGPVPTPMEAAAELYAAALRSYRFEPTGPTAPTVLTAPTEPPAPAAATAAPTAPVWQWDAAAGKPVVARVPELFAARDEAARLAHAAAEIAGNNRFAELLSRAAEIEGRVLRASGEGSQSGAAVTAWSEQVKPTQADVENLLEFLLQHDRPATARHVVPLLAARGGLAALESPAAGRPSALVRAASHPDRGVRLAAVAAIFSLAPQRPFAGSSQAVEALGYFAASTGTRKALVVDISPARARDIAGVLAGMGLHAEIAVTARDAVRLTADDVDYELALVYRPFLNPEMGRLLGQWRADHRTARLPVAVYCEPEAVERTRSLLIEDRYATALYQPRTVDDLVFQLGELEAARSAAGVPPAERVVQAQTAHAILHRLTEREDTLWNLRRFEPRLSASAWHPQLGPSVVAVLGRLRSAGAQRTLADVASAGVQPLATRQAAAAAFCESVIRYGTLLTTTEVLRQYERYNASSVADQASQQVLAKILDVMEVRAARRPGGPSPATPSTAAPPAAAPALPVGTVSTPIDPVTLVPASADDARP